MVKITKASLDELAQQLPLLTEMEQASCLGGTHSAYSSLGTAQKDQENQAIAGLEQSVFSTQIGDTNTLLNDITAHEKQEFPKKEKNSAISTLLEREEDHTFIRPLSAENTYELEGSGILQDQSVKQYEFTVYPSGPIPGVGIFGAFRAFGSYRIEGGIFDCHVGVQMNSNIYSHHATIDWVAGVEVVVDGVSQGLWTCKQLPSGYIYAPGNLPIGDAKINLKHYRGKNIEICVRVGYNFSTGVGYASTHGKHVIFRSKL